MKKIRLLISGGDSVWRQGVVRIFQKEEEDFDVLGTADDSSFLSEAEKKQPDLVIYKLSADYQPDLFSRLKSVCPFTLVVTVVDNPARVNPIVLTCLGVRAILPERLLPGQFVKAVELVCRAGLLCLPRLGPEFSLQEERERKVFLTPREQQILAMLVQNRSNKEIGEALYLSEATVKSHLRSLFRKLEVKNRTEAVAKALTEGLLPAEGEEWAVARGLS